MAHRHRLRPSTRQIRRQAMRRLDHAIATMAHVDDPDPAVAAEAIHEVRVDGKEVRALLRLLEPGASAARRRADRWVDAAGSSLGSARDEQVVADTVAALPVMVDLAALPGTAPDRDAIERATVLLRRARDEVDAWRVGRRSGPVVTGLTAAYRDARRRFQAVVDATEHDADHGDEEAMHAWRRSVKRLTYQVRAVRRWAPGMLRPYAERLDHLGSLLGDHHDLGNAAARLAQDDADQGTVAAAIRAAQARQAVIGDEAVRLGSSLFAETPAAFRRRLRAYVRARRTFGRERARRRGDVTP